ncbi:hypothetical protein [Pyxidicoccus sp. MSG2]|uniref:hypothetical protein n=1 Tax=Pyxidicoccus sp. MSG2 TaxID=2996790 RepID=UPI002270D6D8|nr:hypothetical protein [Pyxidicoccus sp. MSG2]MCY1019687.1 hypothetical protein [Pyxidicoccus sp. MSG2]
MLVQTNQVKKLTLTGKSGRPYLFSLYPFNSNWTSVGAVYGVLSGDPAHPVLLYVGQTEDLQQRFANHHKAFSFALFKATQLAVHLEPNELMRRVIEADLVGHYSPQLNLTNHG